MKQTLGIIIAGAVALVLAICGAVLNTKSMQPRLARSLEFAAFGSLVGAVLVLGVLALDPTWYIKLKWMIENRTGGDVQKLLLLILSTSYAFAPIAGALMGAMIAGSLSYRRHKFTEN